MINIKETPRVLHVVGGMSRAGTETMLVNVYKNIDKTKVQFDFITYYENESDYYNEIRELGGNIIVLSRPEKIGRLEALRELCEAIKNNGPYKAIHSHTLFNCGIVSLAGAIMNVKVRVAHAHTNSDKESSIIRKVYINTMRRLINIFSTDLLACSNDAGKYLYGEKNINSRKYSIFPNYIEVEKFINTRKDIIEKIKDELNIPKESVILGHIGRFEDVKNHIFLIDIFNEVLKLRKNYYLLLIGDGNLKCNIEEKVKFYNIEKNVKFLGIRSDIPELLNLMDLFIFPSKYEGLGMSVIEAQASGIPCIVSDRIPKEANLNINLVETIKLEKTANEWANQILNYKKKKYINESKIKKAFEDNGYSFIDIQNKLFNIYRI